MQNQCDYSFFLLDIGDNIFYFFDILQFGFHACHCLISKIKRCAGVHGNENLDLLGFNFVELIYRNRQWGQDGWEEKNEYSNQGLSWISEGCFQKE